MASSWLIEKTRALFGNASFCIVEETSEYAEEKSKFEEETPILSKNDRSVLPLPTSTLLFHKEQRQTAWSNMCCNGHAHLHNINIASKCRFRPQFVLQIKGYLTVRRIPY